jgi:hypothetical protein
MDLTRARQIERNAGDIPPQTLSREQVRTESLTDAKHATERAKPHFLAVRLALALLSHLPDEMSGKAAMVTSGDFGQQQPCERSLHAADAFFCAER